MPDSAAVSVTSISVLTLSKTCTPTSFSIGTIFFQRYSERIRHRQTGEALRDGANEYRQEDDWPAAASQSTKYFLHSTGKANSLRGDGSLSIAPPKAEPSDVYIYNPANPVPTVGGHSAATPNTWSPVRAISAQ